MNKLREDNDPWKKEKIYMIFYRFAKIHLAYHKSSIFYFLFKLIFIHGKITSEIFTIKISFISVSPIGAALCLHEHII